MTVTSIIASSGRNLFATDAVYMTAHDALSASAQGNEINVGRRYAASTYDIWRSALIFDTSSIPAGAIISSAKLKLYFSYDGTSEGTINIVVQDGTICPHNPVQNSDYLYTQYNYYCGILPTNLLTLNAYNDLPFNVSGIEAIKKGGETKLLMRSGPDIQGNLPGGEDYVQLGDSSVSGQEPTLEVTWTLPAPGTHVDIIKDVSLSKGLSAFNSIYDFARDADSYGAPDPTLSIGQRNGYVIYRSYLLFDTSQIPPSAIIISAELSLYCNGNYIVTNNFDIVIQDGQPTWPHNPVIYGDYNRTHYAGNGGSKSTADVILNAYNNIAIDRAMINFGGITKLCLRSSREINGDVPVDNESVAMGNPNVSGQQPRLILIWLLPYLPIYREGEGRI